MKKIICGAAIVFAFSTVASPTLLTLADYENNIELSSEFNLGKNFKLLYDKENKSAYQITDEIGNTYEYVEEVISKPDGTDEITQKKFMVLAGNQKELLDEKVISIMETATDIIIKELSNAYSTDVVINKTDTQINFESTLEHQYSNVNPELNTLAASEPTSGGSYIAAIRWEESKNNNTAYAIFGTKSKTTTKQQWQYRDFKAAANSIVKEEISIATAGLGGVVDAVWAAVKGGDLLSWELIKKVFGKLGKAVPAVGTIITVYTYISLCLDAKEKYEAIP